MRARTNLGSRLPERFCPAVGIGLACVALVAGEATPVREKIQFSGSGDAPALPTTRPKNELLSRPFEFLDNGNSVSGVVAPSMSPAAIPSYQRNSRLMELFEQRLDQRRNWIFNQSADYGRTPTAEDVFGVGALGATETKPKTALESFLAERSPKPERGRVLQRGNDWDGSRFDKRDQPGLGFDSEERPGEAASASQASPLDSSRILSAGFSLPNDFLAKPTTPGSANELLNNAPADPLAKIHDDRRHSDDFRKLLNLSAAGIPTAIGLERINLNLDTSRPELMPVTAPRLGELPGMGRDTLNLNPLRAGPHVSRLNTLDDQTAKVLGPSSLAPAVSPPVEVSKPRPADLEFPQRRF